jgi:hypothetical protein
MQWITERCVEDGDCLRWRLSIDTHRHPRYTFKMDTGRRITKGVRRVVYEAFFGFLPPRKLVTTSCGCADCLNPEHLTLTTRSKVISETWKHQATRLKKVRAVQQTSRSIRGKLDMDKARYIRASDKTGYELAKELGVSHTVISRVRNGTAWLEAEASPFAGLFAANDPKKRAA